MNINYFTAAEAREQVLDNYYNICANKVDEIMASIREATSEGAYDCLVSKELMATPMMRLFLQELGYKIIDLEGKTLSKNYIRISWRKD